MNHYRWVIAPFLLLVSFHVSVSAQEPAPWHDPSPHTVQFVTVENNVKLEVLDWGGSGPPLVLLAGLGNTAHVFDDFAPKLTPEYHVYGITRRGFGASSAPVPEKGNYSADRLGDDVLAVMDSLKIEKPVLVGHSIAGEELSSVATRHPERIAGLIYLDAAYQYAFYDNAQGFLPIDLRDLKEELNQLSPSNFMDNKELVKKLVQEDIPRFEGDLKKLQDSYAIPLPEAPPGPGTTDLVNFAAFRSWQVRTQEITFPEAELRETYETNPDGGVGKHRDYPAWEAVDNQVQKYTNIPSPILALYAYPHNWGTFKKLDERQAAEAADKAWIDEEVKALKTGAPYARVVLLPHANHYVFLSNEADVLREMRAFLASLH